MAIQSVTLDGQQPGRSISINDEVAGQPEHFSVTFQGYPPQIAAEAAQMVDTCRRGRLVDSTPDSQTYQFLPPEGKNKAFAIGKTTSLLTELECLQQGNEPAQFPEAKLSTDKGVIRFPVSSRQGGQGREITMRMNSDAKNLVIELVGYTPVVAEKMSAVLRPALERFARVSLVDDTHIAITPQAGQSADTVAKQVYTALVGEALTTEKFSNRVKMMCGSCGTGDCNRSCNRMFDEGSRKTAISDATQVQSAIAAGKARG